LKIRSIRLTGLIFSIWIAAACSHHHRVSGNNEAVSKSVKIAVISDLIGSYGSVEYGAEVTAVIKKMEMIKPDIILCAGDMVAGQKATLTEQNIKAMWQGFKQTVLTPVQELNIPFGFTLGNHDASPSYLTDRAMAKQFWRENVQATGLQFIDSMHYPYYFSYILSNIFFISWDAAAAKIPAEVYEWMNKQLAGNTAREAKLRILLGHLPLYPIVEHKNKTGEVNANADSALSFFKNNGIDLYISGHQHAYYPAKKNGVRLLNAGCIGSGERKIMGHTDTAKKAYTIIEVPARSTRQFHYTTYTGGTERLIDPRSLPDSVIGFNGVLYRED
jgi:predicted phosphodiesterase